MTSNMRETLAWLRERGFIVGLAPLDCGHTPTPNQLTGGMTGCAITPDNRRICYACADEDTRDAMRTNDRTFLYLEDAHVSTWSGGIMGRVVSRVTRKMRTPNAWYTHTRVFVRVIDQDGKHWHGSSPGDGMYCRLRATRPLPQPNRKSGV